MGTFDIFNRCQRPLNAVALALCFGCLSLFVSSASAEPLHSSPDEVCETWEAISAARDIHFAETETAEPHTSQNEDLSRQSKSGAAQLLDDEELAQLAARAEEPGADVVGGALDNQQLTYIVIALAAAVVVLVAK